MIQFLEPEAEFLLDLAYALNFPVAIRIHFREFLQAIGPTDQIDYTEGNIDEINVGLPISPRPRGEDCDTGE